MSAVDPEQYRRMSLWVRFTWCLTPFIITVAFAVVSPKDLLKALLLWTVCGAISHLIPDGFPGLCRWNNPYSFRNATKVRRLERAYILIGLPGWALLSLIEGIRASR